MNILIVTQYFWPENFRINDLARGLVERGHRVTVLTGLPNYPGGRFFAGYGASGPWREAHEGIEVIRVPLLPRGGGGRTRLLLNYLSFALSASLLGPWRVRAAADAIFVYEPSPITVGIAAAAMKRSKGAPLLFWVQDLWPESLRATGAVRSAWLLALVGYLVRWIYRRCDLILVQSRAFIPTIEAASVPSDKIRYFPNSAERVEAAPRDGEKDLFARIPDGFRILFAGNIGAAQDFPTILRAAELARGEAPLRWIVVGDGRQAEWLREQIAARSLGDCVFLLGRHPLEAMPGFYAAADALLVTLRRDPVFALTVPSKLQSYLAAAKPVLAALDGEGASIVEEAGCGYVAPTEAPEVLAAQALKMYRTAAQDRARMGASGRTYFEANFERERLLDNLERWLREAGACV